MQQKKKSVYPSGRNSQIWRSILVAFILLGGLVIGQTACSIKPADIAAETGKIIILEPGQKAVFADEQFELRFVEVVNDSRCPKGVQCIWAGEVSSLVELGIQGQQKSLVLTQSGSDQAENKVLDYNITFDVQPYPEASKTIRNKDYRLRVMVTKVPELSGGVLATFRVIEEEYSIFITNPETIEQVYALQRGESNANIPIGLVRRGAVSYNQPWSWHIDSEDISMVEMTIELSDGLPSYLEEDLDYWVDTVKYFSPWSAKLIEVIDYRDS